MAQILIIDDDDALRTMLRLALVDHGHTVIEAPDGKEGLELFRHLEFDMVITDIVMPEVEGTQVLMELRKKRPPVKIIAMSGGGHQSAAEYLHTAKLMGALRVLAKPFSNEELIAAVDALLPGGDASSPPAR